MNKRIKIGSLVGWKGHNYYGLVTGATEEPRTTHMICVEWIGSNDENGCMVNKLDRRLYLVNE